MLRTNVFRRIVSAAFVSLLLVSAVSADVWLNDGGHHVVDYAIASGQSLRCEDGPSSPTTMEFADGGSIASAALYVSDTSQAQVTGGRIEWVVGTYGQSHADILGGDINTIDARENSTINVDDGWIRWYLSAADHGEVTMTGGTLDGSVEAYGDGVIRLEEGTIVDHGDSDYLWAGNNGRIFVHGDFNYGPGPIPDMSGQLTGTMTGGCLLDIKFQRFQETAQIIVVPEPAIMSLLTLGGLVMLRRRRA